jgi:hypothetical protein
MRADMGEANRFPHSPPAAVLTFEYVFHFAGMYDSDSRATKQGDQRRISALKAVKYGQNRARCRIIGGEASELAKREDTQYSKL